MKDELPAHDRKRPAGAAALDGLDSDEKPGKPMPVVGPAYDRGENSRRPSETIYRVYHLPKANIKIDGHLDDPDWSKAHIERRFSFPWKEAEAPRTEFMALCDDEYFYFGFRAEDADIVVLDKFRDKQDVAFEDRIEIFFSCDPRMGNYYNLEIDPRGRVFDCRSVFYRQLDLTWSCKGIETAGATFEGGYVVEGRIPLATLAEMGLPRFEPGNRVLCGLYRAEFSHDRSGKPAVRKESIHNLGRTIDGPPPLEQWISWIDPKTPEPDFHVPSSLGWLEIDT